MSSSGYKVLGFLVWNGAKFYFRHSDMTRKLAMGGLVASAIGVLLLAGRKATGD